MFPGASSGDAKSADYAIFGAPLETSTTFYPGARFGPERIRHFGRGFENYDRDTDQHFSDLDVVDYGDLRGWHDPEEYVAFLSGELGDGRGIPIVLGGEHTVSIAGVRATEPSVFVCVDAHLDLRAEFDGNPWSHATVNHHVREAGVEVVLIGARAGEREEWERAEADEAVTVIEPEDASDRVSNLDFEDRSVYLSIDIDGIDPAFAPATGTREPFGLHPRTVRHLIDAIAPALVGADVVEVNDRDDGQTATLAAKLVRRLIYQHATGRDA